MSKRWMTAIAGALLAWPAAAEEIRPYRVARQLGSMPQYSIYDHFEFQIQGSKVILKGSVHEPVLRERAEKAVRNVKGVMEVENRIEVLPAIEGDETLRIAVARAVYGQPVLGTTPPRKSAIHVVVKGGAVMLSGFVQSESEKRSLLKAARGVSGVASLQDNLRVIG